MVAENQVESAERLESISLLGNWRDIQAALAAPFPEEEVGQVPIDKSGKLLGKYITARSVMDRLDEVVGPGNWSDDYEMWDLDTCAVKCTLTLFGISRSDVGYPNDALDADNAKREPFKAACSDALKRAAVHWGIGRYLYPKPGERNNSVEVVKAQRPATEKQLSYLRKLAESNQVELPDSVDSVGLPMDVASRWIDELQTQGRNATLSQLEHPMSALNDRRVRDAGAASYVTDPVKAPAQRRASANQLATIAKLSRLLGHPELPGDEMTSTEASERITELSREYNERKDSTRRSA